MIKNKIYKSRCIVCNNNYIMNSSAQKMCSKKCILIRNRKLDKYRYKHRTKEEIEKQNKTKRKWNELNKDKLRKLARENFLINKEKIYKYQKEYKIKNKEKIKIRKRKKYYNDERYRIGHILGCRFRIALAGKVKYKSTLKIVGCSVEELKQYLEKRFDKKMSWSNYGLKGWHIDHIIPCCKFDLTKEDEQKKCFHFTNLQPMWAEENYKKRKQLYEF